MGACCVGSCGKVVGGALAIGMIGFGAGAVHSYLVPVAVTLEPAPAGPAPVRPAPVEPAPANGAQAPQGDDPGAAPAEAPRAEGGATPAAPAGELGTFISIPQALALFEQGRLFVDTRTRAQFEDGRVLGAQHLSMHEWGTPEGQETTSLIFDMKGEDIVLYCDGGQCDASENLAIVLRQAGCTRLRIMKDGFAAWRDAGHPVEKGGG